MNLTARRFALPACLLSAAIPVLAADTKPKAEAPASKTEVQLPKAEDLMDKSIEVTGGKAAFTKLKTTVLTGTMAMPAMNLKGSLKSYRAEPALSYTEIELPGLGKMQEGFDGSVAWSLSAMQGPSVKEGDEKLQAIRNARFHSEDWKADCKAIRTLGVETFDGKECYKVEFTPTQGSPILYYLDKKTGFSAGMSMTVKTPMGDMKADMVISDYKKVGDTLMPHKITQNVMGQTIVITFDAITNDLEIPMEVFLIPSEVQKSRKK
jgi:zinc protease